MNTRNQPNGVYPKAGAGAAASVESVCSEDLS